MLFAKRDLIPYLVIAVIVFSGQSFAADIALDPSQTTSFSGQLEILIADNFETNVSQRRYAIRIRQTDGSHRSHALSFASRPPDSSLRSGDRIAIQGRFLGNAIVADSIQRASETQAKEIRSAAEMIPYAPLTIGDRRAIVLIVNMNDAQTPYDTAALASMMYTGTQNVKSLYEASSFQQLSFDPNTDGVGGPDVFGPFTIDHSASEDCTLTNHNYSNIINNWAEAADDAARNQGIDLSLYQHRIYFLPSEVDCGWSGMATLRCGDQNCRVWVVKSGSNSDEGRYIAHELGHNIDWNHSSTDPENDGVLNLEYGDTSGIMGYPYWAQANAPHRDQLDWFDAYPDTLVSATCSDTFDLYALELDPGVDPVGTQVVKIPKPDTNEYYYLSYRREIGPYPSNSEYANKINIHRYNDRGSNTFHITNLAQNDTFQDSANGITVTATSAGGAIAAVTVEKPNGEPAAAFSSTDDYLDVVFNNTSSDSDGNIASHHWDFGDGTSSNQANPSHTYARGGTFSVTLTVTDNCGDTDAQTHAVTIVPNNPPVAGFSSTANHLIVQFNDTSSDNDGNIASHHWNFGDGTSSNQANPSHTYATGGTFSVTLTVTDNYGDTDAQKRVVTIVPNNPPVAGFSSTDNHLIVQFNDTSSDSDGSIASHQWDFGDGTSSNQANPSHTYATGGTFSATLTVTDDDGSQDTMAKNITVIANVAPTARFSFTTDILYVQFSDESADSDGTIASRQWDFGDGFTSVEAAPSHTYASGGTHTVTLTVTDDDGATHTNTQSVAVDAPLIPAAIPDFTFNVNGLSVTFTESSTGSVTSYQWDFGDGATSVEAAPSHTYAQAGTYTVELRVTNAAGSNTATQEVTVPSDTITPDANNSGGGGGGGGCFIGNLYY